MKVDVDSFLKNGIPYSFKHGNYLYCQMLSAIHKRLCCSHLIQGYRIYAPGSLQSISLSCLVGPFLF